MNDLPQFTPSQLKYLEQLDDIDLPQTIGWWPLAWGWWMIIFIAVILIVGTLWVIYWKKKQQYSVKQQALNTLAEIEIAKIDDKVLAYQLSKLLKRVILAQTHQQDKIKNTNISMIAQDKSIKSAINDVSLFGRQWADFLSVEGYLSDSVADFIAHAPYTLDYVNPPEKNQVIAEVKHWINKKA